ncbi:unnamed protein product [Arabidopsis thaliana]|uniref:Fatty acyl-CoA reductase n=1 Tax=Arabidopsis thaliana TaxID=3702 RepID=A0A7G2ER95_ARATH|nr:unnamed protein product [Arabidopsis thaliana]
MEFSCVHFLQNKTILVTGATGFLAKVFVEKILRVQPNVNKLYLVVRASDNEAATKRLRTEAFEKDLFKVLRDNLGDEKLNTLLSEKVVPVAGDIAMDHLGMKDSDLRERMQKEIDVIVNVAATTNFDERYDVGLGINTFGAQLLLNVLNFAKKCVKAQLLLHVSTAYVCGEKPGLLPEKPFVMEEICNENGRQLDINLERELMKQKLKELNEQGCSEEETTFYMKELGMERAKLHGWPNTYVFTKSMGEMLLGNHKENIPLVIIRPTMITSTLFEPFPGWIEGLKEGDKYKNKNRKIDMVMRLVKLYEPYVLFKGIFDDRNTKNLCAKQKEEDNRNSENLMFDFDPKIIRWKDYLINVHIPGLITHVLKK